MAEHVSPTQDQDIRPIHRLIRRTRLLLRSSWVATGLGVSVGLLLAVLVTVTTLDLLMPFLWPALRLAALLLVVVPASWAFFIGVIRPLFRRLSATHVARRIESHIPRVHNRLVSCIDLANKPDDCRRSGAFYRRLVSEALERIRGFRPSAVINFLGLRRAGLFAASSIAAFLVAWLLFADRMPTAMARILSPFADIPPASGVVYTVEPGDAGVLRGEDVAFMARVEKGEPEELYIELHGDGTKPLRHNLVKQDVADWRFTLSTANIAAGFERAFRYRIHGGGTWSKQYTITIHDRPTIVNRHTVLHYPEYMAMPEPRVGPPQTLEVTGPEGSQVEVVVEAEGDVAEGEIQFLEPRKRVLKSLERAERIWFDDKLPAGAQAEGAWQWQEQFHGKSAHTEPVALGTHGHWFQAAPVGFQVREGEVLFTYVYLVPEQKPEALMLEWHDGAGWERRAYWGDDRIASGKGDTPARRKMGPLPPAGQWVRLEVPAALVGLEGKSLHGMAFKLYSGQCAWHRAGAIPQEAMDLAPVKTFPMQIQGENRWSGRFPLSGTGLYRVELRNALGHANKTMKEAKYLAIPDNPPQVVLERPGTDMVLSEPGKVPLVVAAYDDFSLADVVLSVQRGDSSGFADRVLKHYDKPLRSDTVLSSLDLVEMKLKVGEHVRYRVEARDRKGQSARTQEYVVRIAADPNAADKQLAALDKGQDDFREKLTKLIAEQAKVKTVVEELTAQYTSTVDKIKAAQAEQNKPATADPKQPATPEQPKLDPATAKQLDSLQKEMAKLAQQEQQNAQAAKQLDDELARSAEQMGESQLVPPELANQMAALQQQFQQRAVQPLQNLAGQMSKGADPKQGAPDVKNIKENTQRVQKELEALLARLEAVAKARKELPKGADDALAKLREEMQRANAGAAATDLEELKKFMKELEEELKRLGAKQEKLHDATEKIPDEMLPDVKKRQADLEKELERLLAQVKEIQKKDKMRRMKRRPDLPKEPYDPDAGEERVPPKEEDPDEPDKKDATKIKPGEKKDGDKKSDVDEDKEPLFMPALGGPRPKEDPRFKDKKRSIAKKPKPGDKGNSNEERNDLEARQASKLDENSQAQQSLQSDENTLAGMLQQLRQAMSGKPSSGQNEDGMPDLSQLLQSPALQQALAMARRAQQIGGGNQSGGKTTGLPNQASTGNLSGGQAPRKQADGDLVQLDPATRGVILKMPPRLREELLQGMREEGPEGYRKFIDDYFKRLTEVKSPK
jgi:hypothetical protein